MNSPYSQSRKYLSSLPWLVSRVNSNNWIRTAHTGLSLDIVLNCATVLFLCLQSSARPPILFETKTKTCLDIWFLSIPIPRHVLMFHLSWDQYQDLSWFLFHFKTNTKTYLDFCFNSRPIPRVLLSQDK